ncbi:MAG: LamG domain-containing protein [Lentisphaeria bacterium]|nr:LamG domain-containing protein [Lentisphaeria bacterium]
MKKLFLLLPVLCFSYLLSAKTTVEYAFILNVDEGIRDISGQGNHPESTLLESSWIKEDLEAVRFVKDGDSVKVPSRAFPGSKGSLEMVVRHERPAGGSQYLFSTYSPKGDGLHLISRRGKISLAYYDRSEKKWYSTNPAKALPRNVFSRITATWELPGTLKFYINGILAGSCDVPVDKTDFKTDSVLRIASNHQGGAVFQGSVNRFTLTDAPIVPDTTALPVQKEKITQVKLGKFTCDFAAFTLCLRGLEYGGIQYMSDSRNEPLWTLRMRNTADNTYTETDAAVPAKTSLRKINDKKLELQWQDVSVPGGTIDVTACVELNKDNELAWTIRTSKLPSGLAVDMMTFPCLPCAPTAAQPEKMFLTYGRYYGTNAPDPFTFTKPRSGMMYGNVYPGGSHFQFGYLYGENVPGLIFHAADPNGHYKEFLWTAYPENKALIFSLGQFPEQRAISGFFQSAYPVRTAVLKGDWYDAARYYRQWAVRQPWCGAGKLIERRDLPAWVFDAHVALRPSTLPKFPLKMENAIARIPQNMINFRKMASELGCGGLSVWYNYNCPTGGTSVLHPKKWMAAFNARCENTSIPGVRPAVDEMAKRGYFNVGYINSRIYDESPDPAHAETQHIIPMVMRDVNGGLQKYNRAAYDVCRASDGWREHLLNIIKKDAIANNFAGMYLDSFGRGQFHCWSDNHDHKPGCNTTSVHGQRKMAEYIRKEMRKIIPGFVISSEASVEQFVDLIDFKLHHENVFPNHVPVWTVIYHDYQFVYGRTVSRPKIQVSACFHIGALLGRIFMDNKGFEKTYFPEGIYAYYRKLIAMRKHFYKQIGVGEMLRPPVVSCATPDEKVNLKNMKFDYPAVPASAWRDANGVPVAFFTNRTDRPETISFELDKNEFKTAPKRWLIADENGKLIPQKYTGNTITLPPLGVAALEF